MKVLVTGATGTVGSEVVKALLQRGADVRALTRKQPKPGTFPGAVEIALGDLSDPVSVAEAMKGVHKLFPLIGTENVPVELTQALYAYGLAKKAGLKHVTYVSVYKADQFLEVPHFANKFAIEEAIRVGGVPYTILRPAYFAQNERRLKPELTGLGVSHHDGSIKPQSRFRVIPGNELFDGVLVAPTGMRRRQRIEHSFSVLVIVRSAA